MHLQNVFKIVLCMDRALDLVRESSMNVLYDRYIDVIADISDHLVL